LKIDAKINSSRVRTEKAQANAGMEMLKTLIYDMKNQRTKTRTEANAIKSIKSERKHKFSIRVEANIVNSNCNSKKLNILKSSNSIFPLYTA